MKAVARLFWMYCTALPIQRWLGAFALVTLPLAAPLRSLRHNGLVVLPVLAIVFYIVATMFAVGYLFRVASAPRAHRFLPHFRGRNLCAFLGVMVLVFALCSLLNAVFTLRSPLIGILVVPLFSAVVAATFFPTGWLVAVVVLLGPIASLAVWVAFALWYLRVPRVETWRPPTLFAGGKLDLRLAYSSGVFDRATALRAELAGAYPRRARQLITGLSVLALLTFALAELIRAGHNAGVVATMLMILPAFVVAPVCNRLARRTKLLWLKSGLSRRELFAAAEAAAWRTAVVTVVAASVALAASIALLDDLSPEVLARDLACAVASDALAVYVGLVLVRPFRVLDVIPQVLLVVSPDVGIWAVLAGPARDGVLVATILVQVAAALALRAIAIGRWRRIDWLVFRPMRVASQSVRAGT